MRALALAAVIVAFPAVPAVASRPGCHSKACEARVSAKRARWDRKWCRRHRACVARVRAKKEARGRAAVVAPLRGTLMAIAACESHGNPRAISPGGRYRGLLQFSFTTWAGVGGHGDPAAASMEEQLYRGALLYRKSGRAPWPVCGR